MKQTRLSPDGLKAAIGLPSAVMLVIGGIVGVGIFVNPAVVARSLHSPWALLSAWALGGAIAMLGAFVYAELAARMPATGGEYVYLRDTYGRLAGFLFGWTTLLVVHAGGMAAVAIVFAQNLNVLCGGAWPEYGLVLAVLAGLAGINCAGVQSGNHVQASLGALKIVSIGVLIVAGLHAAPHANLAAPAATGGDGLKAFAAAMIPVVFSYGGWQTANYAAGEITDSGRNLAHALLIGVAAVIALYLLINVACLHALGTQGLAATLTPAADVLRRVAGPTGGRLASGAIALSAIGYLSQGMLTGPRVIFAMARDGLFFGAVARVADGSHVPVAATILFTAWTMVLALSGTYEQILSYDIATNFLFFGVSASCLFALRQREAGAAGQGYRAFGHPWTTGAFIAACAAVVLCSFWSYPLNSLIGYGILLLGVPAYFYWQRKAR